jgi:hypothetical protein
MVTPPAGCRTKRQVSQKKKEIIIIIIIIKEREKKKAVVLLAAGARVREPGKPLKLRDRSLVPTVKESSGGLRESEPEVHGIFCSTITR